MHGIWMDQRSLSPQDRLEWLAMPPSAEDQLLRHIPRVLGVLPLLPLAYGLFTQGGASRGAWMVVVVLMVAVITWGCYTLITHLTIKEYQPEETHSQAWHRKLEDSIIKWIKKDGRSFYKLFEFVTASPYPFEAFTLRYRCPAADGQPKTFDLREDLIKHNSAIRNDDEALFNESYDLDIDSINNIKLDSTKKIRVGENSWIHYNKESKNLSFTSEKREPRDLIFPFRVSLVKRPPETERYYDTGEVRITIDSNTVPESDQDTNEEQQHILNTAYKYIVPCMQAFKYMVQLLLKLRVQIAVVAATIFLFQTSQVRDVLLAMILDNRIVHFLMATLMGLLLSVLLWLTSRYLLRIFPLIEKRRKETSNLQLGTWKADGSFQGGTGIFSHKTELILFWLAWMSLAFFTIVIAREAFSSPGQSWGVYLIKPYLLFTLGALLIWLWRRFDRPVSTLTKNFQLLYFVLFFLGATLPFGLALLSKTAQALPDFMGSIAILFWGMSLFLVIGQIIYQFSIVSSIPLLTLLLVGIYFFGINRINDNHQVRLERQVADLSLNPLMTKDALEESLMNNKHLPHLEVALGQWLLQRKADIERYKQAGKKYPIYVISAQGGGIYAAYHSAKALAVLSEQVPSFSDHVFAISGVSGGSVGATVFTNALRTQANGPEGLSNRIDQYFSDEHDRLAMILSAMLFGNAAQTLFPLPVAAWDRSLGLELGFENRKDPNPSAIKLDDSFYLTQDPTLNRTYTQPSASASASASNAMAGQAAPYLVLNTTEVENGRRYIFSPFRLREGYISEHPRLTDADFHEPWLQRPTQMKPLDIRFSTAAGLSARFPVVSPYGFFPGSRSRRLIDGGLYDNSGAITAREIIDSINTVTALLTNKNKDQQNNQKNNQQNSQKYFVDFTPQEYATLKSLADNIVVYPIAIVDQKAVSLDSSYADAEVQEHRKRFKWLGWSAIDAVFSTREARLQKAVDLLDHDSPRKKRILLRKDFRLEGNPQPVFSIPLGWTLSCQARSFINDQIQPLPTNFDAQNPKVNQDGNHYSLLPCEKQPANANPSEIINNSGMKREQVRTRADRTLPKIGVESGEASLSLSFWELIADLKKELALPPPQNPSPNPPAGQSNAGAAKARSAGG